MLLDFPYLFIDQDRHGNERVYVRRHGRKIRLRETKGTPSFIEAYREAIEALDRVNGHRDGTRGPTAASPGTVGWLMAKYLGSAEFKALAPASRRARRAMLDECAREPRRPNAPKDVTRDCPLRAFNSPYVKMLRDRVASKPGAAANRMKHLSAVFGWAIENGVGGVAVNPVRDVRSIKKKSGGFYTWTEADVEKFEAFYPIGTKPRLALALLLYSGSRRQDMVTFGRQHIRDGWLRFVPKKTLYKRNRLSEKPVLPVLADIIARSPCGDLTFLQTEYGKAFTPAGFGGWFRDKCNAAGLPKCTAHGLRKAGATRAAENGATDRELMALFDWDSPSMAAVYTKAASQKRLAQQSVHLMQRERAENTTVTHLIDPPPQTIEKA
jgi:integrase